MLPPSTEFKLKITLFINKKRSTERPKLIKYKYTETYDDFFNIPVHISDFLSKKYYQIINNANSYIRTQI